jgi:hypothetical protein
MLLVYAQGKISALTRAPDAPGNLIRNIPGAFMKNHIAVLISLFLFACILAAPAQAAEKAAGKAEDARVTAVKKVIERAKPARTPVANVLAPLTGTWDFTAKVWSGTGGELEQTAGTATNEMILDDRFLSSTILGSVIIAGHEVMLNARGLLGYDKGKDAFTSVWIDTLGTGMMTGSGKYDEKNSTLTQTGRFTDPVDGVEKGFRSELRMTDPGHYTRTVFAIGKSGKESKLMEFEFSRRS